MALIADAGNGKTFELPKEGTVQGTLAEVRDLGLVDQTFNGVTKKVRKVLFRWQLAELDAEKQPKRIYSRFSLSLHEKSSLRKTLAQIFGKQPPSTLDLDTLVGTNSNLVIQHNESNGKQYANIVAYLKLPAGTPKLEIVKIAPPKEKIPAAGSGTDTRTTIPAAESEDFSDIPF